MPLIGARSRGPRMVLIVSLLASAVVAPRSHADAPAPAPMKRAGLQVAANVVPACSIVSRGALALRCASFGRVMIETTTVQNVRIDQTHDGHFTITTINF
jgi:hypothetical protein